MNLADLYAQTPVEKHHEIIVSGDRVFFEGEEFILDPEGNLRKIHSWKEIYERLDRIEGYLKRRPGKTEVVKLRK